MAKFKRVAEAFDEAAAKARRLHGGGDHHSPPETAEDLSDLVESFYERGGEERERNVEGSTESDGDGCDREERDELSGLLGCGDDDDEVRRNIHEELEKACGIVGNGLTSSPEFKRRVVARLRDSGFDAGLCKSKRNRVGQYPSVSHEYVDITVSGTRFIIEFSLSAEFSIARGTKCYSSLLKLFPPIFIGKLGELKRVVRLMCSAMKASMKSMDMPVPPWRRFGYMQAKWFSPDLERTTGEVTVEMGPGHGSDSGRQRQVGFGPMPLAFSYHCREDFASKVGLKVGQLAVAFDGANILL